MAREYLTSKQVQDYRELCKERDQGRILTPDGLIFICEAYHFEPEAIGRYFIEIAAKYKAERGGQKCMSDSIKELTEKIVAFRDARNWKQFHNPKDMAISISLEAAELLEVFQWSGTDTAVDTEEKLAKVKEELADVLIYALLMGNDLELDIPEIVSNKIDENNRKYPTEKAYGKADKYTTYAAKGEKSE